MPPDPKDSLKDLETELFSMNRLVEHMEKQHAPLMTAYECARVETVMKETGWSRG